MLNQSKLVSFIVTANPEQSKAFYKDVIGLTLIADTPFALVFDSNGTTLRIQKMQTVPELAHTVLGWEVANMATAVSFLQSKGVQFEQFEGIPQDEAGVWTIGNEQIAWFKDPDGNTLSINSSS